MVKIINVQDIEALVNQTEAFAEIWMKTVLEQKEIEIIHLPADANSLGGGLETATLILAPMDQFEAVEDAFVCLFKQYLYYHEEWQPEYGNEMSSQEWEKYLKEIWFPVYLRTINFQQLSGELFMLRFLTELNQLNIDVELLYEIKAKCENLMAIELRRGILDYDVVAFNKDICLIYSWGITH